LFLGLFNNTSASSQVTNKASVGRMIEWWLWSIWKSPDGI